MAATIALRRTIAVLAVRLFEVLNLLSTIVGQREKGISLIQVILKEHLRLFFSILLTTRQRDGTMTGNSHGSYGRRCLCHMST